MAPEAVAVHLGDEPANLAQSAAGRIRGGALHPPKAVERDGHGHGRGGEGLCGVTSIRVKALTCWGRTCLPDSGVPASHALRRGSRVDAHALQPLAGPWASGTEDQLSTTCLSFCGSFRVRSGCALVRQHGPVRGERPVVARYVGIPCGLRLRRTRRALCSANRGDGGCTLQPKPPPQAHQEPSARPVRALCDEPVYSTVEFDEGVLGRGWKAKKMSCVVRRRLVCQRERACGIAGRTHL